MDLIQKLADRPEKRRVGQEKREFLAVRSEIAAALQAGYSIREVWEYLFEQKLISIRYQSFYSYVRFYGLRKKDLDARSFAEPGASTPARPDNKPMNTKAANEQSSPRTGFTHQPLPKEDLL